MTMTETTTETEARRVRNIQRALVTLKAGLIGPGASTGEDREALRRTIATMEQRLARPGE